MSNSIEWAKVGPDSHSTPVFSALDALTEDPDHQLLAPEFEYWNMAIRAEDVVLYADSPQELEKWLSSRLAQVREYMAQRQSKLTEGERWSVIVRSDDGSSHHVHTPDDDPAGAAWAYLNQVWDRPDSDVIQLVRIDQGATTVMARSDDPANYDGVTEPDYVTEPEAEAEASTVDTKPTTPSTGTPQTLALYNQQLVAAVAGSDASSAHQVLDSALEYLHQLYTEQVTLQSNAPLSPITDAARTRVLAGPRPLVAEQIDLAVRQRNTEAATGALLYLIDRARAQYDTELRSVMRGSRLEVLQDNVTTRLGSVDQQP